MKTAFLVSATLVILCAVSMPAQDASESRTPEQVVKHHLAVFTQHDLEGVLSDYADDAIFIAPKQTVQGKVALRHLFESFFATGDNKAPAPVFEAKVTADGDVGYEHWISNPGKPGSMAGTDAFVVRHGKILFHTVVEVHSTVDSRP
jgi:ketosteroid isomerase-like protein